MSFPRAAFEAQVLRDLDAPSRAAIEQAGRERRFAGGERIYQAGAPADAFFVVLQGAARLGRRTVQQGDTFGEEATLPGLTRLASAQAVGDTRLAEIPIAVFRRATGRAGSSEADRQRRYLHRALIREVLAASFGEAGLEPLLDRAELRRFARGSALETDATYVVVSGTCLAPGPAFFTRGDVVTGEVTAAGDTWCVRLPAGLVSASERPGQREVVAEAQRRDSRNLLHDVHRLRVARSLVVIDQERCVQCGHCAASCQSLHGVSRLSRRGEVMVTPMAGVARTLSLPGACQQCTSAACLVDCPTSAIGRDAAGQVFIRAELCTGCGSCAKACPWQNIAMAPAGERNVAVKCDSCREHAGPACVAACPTEAIFRLEPERALPELAALVGREPPKEPAPPRQRPVVLVALVVCVAALGLVMRHAGAWHAGRGAGLVAGVTTAVLLLALAAHAVLKRGRVRVAPWVELHTVLGLVAVVGVVAHTGLHVPPSPGGALLVTLAATCMTGLWGALAYAVIPPRLAALSRRALLPEDLPGEHTALMDKLYARLSGADELVKTLAARVLMPQARRSWLGLVAGGSLDGEARTLRQQVDGMLAGRGEGRLQGLDELITLVVEIRALRARRWLTLMLRGWLPLHLVGMAMTLALLLAHVVHR